MEFELVLGFALGFKYILEAEIDFGTHTIVLI